VRLGAPFDLFLQRRTGDVVGMRSRLGNLRVSSGYGLSALPIPYVRRHVNHPCVASKLKTQVWGSGSLAFTLRTLL